MSIGSFAARFPDSLLLIQVGCFFECYDAQAEHAIRLLGLRPLAVRRGFHVRCGFPVRLFARYQRRLLKGGFPVTVIREVADRPWLSRVKTRCLVECWKRTLSLSIRKM